MGICQCQLLRSAITRYFQDDNFLKASSIVGNGTREGFRKGDSEANPVTRRYSPVNFPSSIFGTIKLGWTCVGIIPTSSGLTSIPSASILSITSCCFLFKASGWENRLQGKDGGSIVLGIISLASKLPSAPL